MRPLRYASLSLLLAACGGTVSPVDAIAPDALDATRASDVMTPPDASPPDAVTRDATTTPDAAPDATRDAPADQAADHATVPDVIAPPPCATRVYYGSAWMRPAGHDASYDDVAGEVHWDGACHDDGSGNSYAVLSNGWRPFFAGRSACVLDLDYGASCPSRPAGCETRVTYGPAWLPPTGHPASYDDVPDAVLWSGVCTVRGAQSSTELSNGWAPTFTGAAGCELSLRYVQCGALYANPVVDTDCPDPGVVRDGARYVMACTSGNAAAAFPLRTSADLVHWSGAGSIFASGHRPAWASGDFWAPEVHRVGTHWVAYFTARNAADGMLSVGAASAPSATGPFTDLGHPLVHHGNEGLIDASEYEAPDGARYLLWKVDGNATGHPTPIFAQRLAADGLSLTGTSTPLITNDRAWEGNVVEGPWMIDHGGFYYLFYSGNGYASSAYALGVARASSPLGPFVKAAAPLVTSLGRWQGPGHGSVVLGPGGEEVFVYHAWEAGHVGSAPGRLLLADRVLWSGGWPSMPQAPSSISQPLP